MFHTPIEVNSFYGAYRFMVCHMLKKFQGRYYTGKCSDEHHLAIICCEHLFLRTTYPTPNTKKTTSRHSPHLTIIRPVLTVRFKTQQHDDF